MGQQNETLLMVVAFNEWTEQAVLEPTDAYGTAYLDALRSVLQRHGQYRYTGEEGLWKETIGPAPPQITECAQPGFRRGVRKTLPYNHHNGRSKAGGAKGGGGAKKTKMSG